MKLASVRFIQPVYPPGDISALARGQATLVLYAKDYELHYDSAAVTAALVSGQQRHVAIYPTANVASMHFEPRAEEQTRACVICGNVVVGDAQTCSPSCRGQLAHRNSRASA